jgi:hypothetical protein
VLLGALGLGCATRPPRSQPPGRDASVLAHVPVREFKDDNCGPGSLSVVLNALGDPVTEAELVAALPRAPGGGVLSVDMLLAARQRGFTASLVSGTEDMVRSEIAAGRPVILLLRLLNAPGSSRDIYHYVVVDGVDPGRDLLRFQFGDGKVRWSTLEPLEGAWEGAGHALLAIRGPDDARPLLREAVALEQAGRLDEAAARYRLIVESHPDSTRAWVNLGNVQSQQGKDVEAEQAYRHALAMAPEDPDALNNLAWLLLQRGSELEEAEQLARTAASKGGPDLPLVLDTLARIQGAQGHCDEAAVTFVAALGAPDLTSRARIELDRGRRELQQTCRPAPNEPPESQPR